MMQPWFSLAGRRAALAAVVAGLILAGCSTPAPTQDVSAAQTSSAATAAAQMTMAAPAATSTATPPAPGPTAAPDFGVPVIATPAAGEPAATARYNTYVFSGPGKDYVVYGAFLGNQQALVVGKSESGSWWAISIPPAPGGTGWVDGAWVTVTGADGVPTLPTPPVPPSTALVPPAAGDPQATALVNTYVRSGPGETYPAFGIAPAGVTARVLGASQDGAWWVVRLDPTKVGAGYGWVSASMVQASNTSTVPVIQSPPPPAEASPSPPAAGAPSATAAEYVYVRSGAGTCYSAYGVAAPGASAEVAGKSSDGQWWQVKIPSSVAADGVAWVSSAYVTTSNVASVPVVPSEPCASAPVAPPATYACYLASQSPEDYTQMKPGTTFDMVWQVVNASTVIWNKNVAHFVGAGSSGTLHTGGDTVGPLTDDISNGESVEVRVPAKAPSASGTYGELWEINANGTVVCQFWMIVEVK
ncbi:MAG TPA: NBR1-Ig-like domain-containing protein [Anaerolineales bacterium]|nr:NBR1-Ig-like domain-containing protein [Anaerolineales bacterium]